MEEMSEQDRQTRDAVLTRRQRIAMGVLHALGLLGGLFGLLIFLAVVRTGYISSIGLTVGAFLTVPGTLTPIAGLAGRKRLEKLLSWAFIGTIILILVAATLVLVWPEDHGTWRPYRFDEELAAIEAERTVPDANNAALRYESVLATVDVDDRPQFVTYGGNTHSGLSQIPWTSADHPEASQWLDLHAEVIEKLLPIGGMEKCRWPAYANADCLWTVPYKKMAHGVWLLTVAGNRDLGEGRLHQALEEYFCLLRTADHLHQQTDTLDFQYSLSCERESLQMIRYILVDSRLSSEDTQRIANRLPTAADTWREDTLRLLVFDRLRFAGLMAPIYEINERGRIRFAASFSSGLLPNDRPERSSRLGRLWRLYWLLNMPLHPRGVLDMAHREFDGFERVLGSSAAWHTRKDYERPFWSFLTLGANAARFLAHEMCVDTSVVVREHYRESHVEQMARRRGTWLLLGLRRYRDAHNVWPDTLDAVSAYAPPEAYSDPASGGAFVYARDGDSFRLYSKGLNRIDEGGRNGYVKALDKVEDDIWIWPPAAPEPEDDKSTDDEMMKLMEKFYGPGYVETLKRGDRSDKQ